MVNQPSGYIQSGCLLKSSPSGYAVYLEYVGGSVPPSHKIHPRIIGPDRSRSPHGER